MELMSNKRPAESEQNGDTFAVCTSCSRLSFNLRTCDKCGSALAEDSSAQCYSAEPKRPRIDGGSAPATRPPSAPTAPGASPSALDSGGVRPQTLFVNMNNQAYPVTLGPHHPSLATQRGASPATIVQVTSSGPSASAAGVTRPRATLGTSQAPVVPVAMTYTGGGGVGTGGGVQHPNGSSGTHRSQVILPAPALSSVPSTNTQRPLVTPTPLTNGGGSAPQISLPSYNLQPPPPPFSSNIARLPVVVSNSPSIPAMVGAGGGVGLGQSGQTWQVQAIEIRIGSKKFKPCTPVTFKDEGVLFMLKDFTYAPVLLNTRAIIKCRANLSTFGYPALLLYLENSCMRQIRNIFGLAGHEFNASSPVELRKCISIFPQFGSENRSQVQSLTYSIKRTFEAMVRRYPRSTPILDEITNEQVLDILLEACDTGGATTTAGASPPASGEGGPVGGSVPTGGGGARGGVASVSGASGVTTATTSSVSVSAPMSLHAPAAAAHRMFVGGAPSVLPPPAAAGVSAAAAMQRAPVPNGGVIPAAALGAPQSPQVLVIPPDATRWQALQKSLVVGGVYHVMVQTGQRKYCLWNGTQLVPCMVQNTEVQLSCAHVRIGSLHVQCVGQVRIRAEPPSGIHFTIKGDSVGQQEVSITPDDIITAEVCFNRATGTTLVFVVTSWATTEKLRTRLGMQTGREPAFEPMGTDMRRKYLMLFLTDVNRDQEEALTQMKFSRSPSGQQAFDLLDLNSALSRLAAMRSESKTTTSAQEYLALYKLSMPDGFERLAREAQEFDVRAPPAAGSGGGPPPAPDDDDDDVIMTQEELGIKCPYTQQVMRDPVRNKVCGHNYERTAILEFIQRRKGVAKCPYAGCGQTVALRAEDLVDNVQLKEYIARNHLNTTSTSTM